ncbi:hypothetical protein ACFX13_028893 [Malus domestica]
MSALREGGKKIAVVKKNVAKVTPPSSQGSGNIQEDSMKTAQLPTGEMAPSSWPWQEPYRFNLNDGGVPVADLNQPSMIPISIHPDGGNPDSTVVVTCFKSMTWVIENKNSTSAGKVAVINLKLQDYGKNPAGEKEVQFRLTRVTLEPMSMTYQSAALCTSQQSCCHQFEASRYKDNFWRNGGQVSGFQRYTRLHVDINGLHP